MDVDFGHGGDVVRLSADTTDNAEVIHSLEFSISKKPLPKAKKPSVTFHPNLRTRSAVSVLEYRYSLTRLSLSILASHT